MIPKQIEAKPTISNKYDRLCFRVILRLGNVSREPANLIFSAGRLALMQFATEATMAHSYVVRHDGLCSSLDSEV